MLFVEQCISWKKCENHLRTTFNISWKRENFRVSDPKSFPSIFKILVTPATLWIYFQPRRNTQETSGPSIKYRLFTDVLMFICETRCQEATLQRWTFKSGVTGGCWEKVRKCENAGKVSWEIIIPKSSIFSKWSAISWYLITTFVQHYQAILIKTEPFIVKNCIISFKKKSIKWTTHHRWLLEGDDVLKFLIFVNWSLLLTLGWDLIFLV